MGLSTALRLAQVGINVALVARRQNLLEGLAQEINRKGLSSAIAVPADLGIEADPTGTRRRMYLASSQQAP
ncbi:MAG: hypothetical protein E4H27_00365 [Anaerolineales bacterium]|nr:MAG: hypothetical protein E4H27_00365 [Anaerolineales bacterium]